MNGKGRGPMKGYNHHKYAENYDQIFRKPTKPNQLKPMKTNQDGLQPAPVLAWHRELAEKIDIVVRQFCGHTGTLPDFAELITMHDPHAAQDATTVRLLEEAQAKLDTESIGWSAHKLANEIRTHLAKLKGTQ